MRIIGGRLKGRKFEISQSQHIRPTTDFAKEAIFNIIENNFNLPQVSVLDLFAGTGSISMEFASRGCLNVTCVEGFIKAANEIKSNLYKFELSEVKVVTADVFKFIEKCLQSYHIVFADPPYNLKELNQLPDLILNKNLVSTEGWLIIEHGADTNFTSHSQIKEVRKYGNVNFSIFTCK